MVSVIPYVKRIVNAYPDFVLGTGNEAFSKVLESSLKNRASHGQTYWQALKQGTKDGFIAAEKHNKLMKAKHGSFWKSIYESIKTTPKVIQEGWVNAGTGKSGLVKFFSKIKGALSGACKRMPLIGTLLITVTSLPNIISAFKDDGIIGGVFETGKEAVKIGSAAGCSAMGAAILSPIPVVGPILGGLLGWVLGESLAGMVVGKSHSEKMAQLQTDKNIPFNGSFCGNFPQGLPVANPMQSLIQNYNTDMMNDDFMETVSGINKINYLG